MPLKPRRHHSPEEKVRVLRLHLLEGRAVSEICDSESIHPTQFYQWQKTFFENGAAVFERQSRVRDAALVAALAASVSSLEKPARSGQLAQRTAAS